MLGYIKIWFDHSIFFKLVGSPSFTSTFELMCKIWARTKQLQRNPEAKTLRLDVAKIGQESSSLRAIFELVLGNEQSAN